MAAPAERAAPTEAVLAAKSERARLAMAGGNFADAAALYRELTQALPDNAGLLMNLGMALHMAGEDARAIEPLAASLKIEPLPPALLFLGASYLRTGQPAKAVAPLRRFARVEPEHREVRQMLADAAMQSGQPSEAATHLAQLAEWEPSNPRVWYALGTACRSIAENAFEKIPPQSGYWLALAADSRSQQNQNRAAFLLYRKALERIPRHRGLHSAIAGIYERTGHAGWAAQERAAEAALGEPDCKAGGAAARTPGASQECHFREGRYSRLLAGGGQTPEAIYWRVRAADALSRQAFGKLEQLGPSLEWHRFRAELAAEQGRHAEAAAAWRAAIETSPADPSLQLQLASSLLRTNDYDGAGKIAEALARAGPAPAELDFLRGEILMGRQKPAEAIPFLEKAAAAEPGFLPARASLGRALTLAGRGGEGIPHLKAALPLDEDASLHFQLARAYQAAGQAALAKQTLARYQELRKRFEQETGAAEEAAQITAPPVR